MWALNIKVREKWNIYNERASKFKVKLYFYSQNYYEEKGKIYFVASGIVEGEENNKKRFFSSLKRDKKVVNLEWNNDFFICTYSEGKNSKRSKAVKAAYNPKLIFLKPVIIDEEGREEWEIAAPSRNDLGLFIKHAEKLANVEYKVLYFKEKKMENLMIYAMLPKLTNKQKKALMLAVERGYYGYPRKITLEKLAKQINLSTSTFQFHLAKAEAKLMPFLVRQY
ncbi:helix-turn-helix domain-containing protein [Candidatus Pacearchaeota archaeon]|nr:helix-turn-helix domain-containing protein [Candidatus Pacearchaeota archaeon]